MQGEHLLLDLCLNDLVLLGAAAEDLLALVGRRTVKAVVPLAQGVLVAGAVLAAQHCNGEKRH